MGGSMHRPSLMNKIVIHHYQIKSLEVAKHTATCVSPLTLGHITMGT